MCGRYASFLPAAAIARIFGTVNPLPNLAPSGERRAGERVAVVRRHPETGARYARCGASTHHIARKEPLLEVDLMGWTAPERHLCARVMGLSPTLRRNRPDAD